MMIKEKCGEVEFIYPDKDLKSVMVDVVKQNQIVLDMNKMIITTLITSPLLQVTQRNEEEVLGE